MTRTDLAVLRDMLKRDEALRLLPYDDATGLAFRQGDTLKGNLTIGYGRAIGLSGITQDEAASMLSQDIERHNSDLIRAFPIVSALDSARQIVLAAMCFNLGIGKLRDFVNMWQAIEDGEYLDAAAHMRDSVWARQVGARATRLADIMASGVLPT